MRHERKIIYLAGFLATLPVALMAYVNSSYLSTFVGEKMVGLIYALGSVASILGLLAAPVFFKKFGGYKFLLFISLLNALSIILFATTKNVWVAPLLFIIGFTLNILLFFTLDELLKISTKNSVLGRTRGIYLSVTSLAWVISEFILGSYLGDFSLRTIYLASFIVMFLFFLVTYFLLSGISDPKYDTKNTKIFLKEFFKNKNLSRTYLLNLLLQIFYCWMVIYTPLYLSSHLGFSWNEIGLIFTIMLLPFLVIPFALGNYADLLGERKILMWGYTINSLATISLFFIVEHDIWIWALLLLLTRIGAASIEVAIDSYFFKHIRSENEEFVGVYRSTVGLAYIIGPFLAILIFNFLPAFNFLFLILGALMLFGTYLASTIRKSDI